MDSGDAGPGFIQFGFRDIDCMTVFILQYAMAFFAFLNVQRTVPALSGPPRAF